MHETKGYKRMQPPPRELADWDHRVRTRAIHTLVELRNPLAGGWIRPLLRDRESVVRAAAIAALGELHSSDSFEALVEFLDAPTVMEQEQAVAALVALGDPRMRTPFLKRLQYGGWYAVRLAIVRALSAFRGEGEVIDALIRTLEDQDEDVRATAAVALSRMRAGEALPALERMAETDTNQETWISGGVVRNHRVAQRAIEIIRAPEQTPDLDWPG